MGQPRSRAAMKHKLPINWPPLRTGARLSHRVILRDILLTVGAWLLLYWLTRRGLMLIGDGLNEESGGAGHGSAAGWTVWWARLRFYTVAVGVLAVWLVIWGRVSRRRIRRYHATPTLVPLSLAEEAVRANCSVADLTVWRELKSTVVNFDATGRIIIRPLPRNGVSQQAAPQPHAP